ncbi:glycosyltransferase family 4 protein [Dactylosporangium sp. CA-092794]|uniref:glycosyltransferase family 4 protein n=1 Tax=Dactylosporangium sp. CA-092794 TaxID=3239929 RepID=UPI003D902791
MRVLITVVGKRTEHWTELFAALCERPDIELTLAVADVSAGTLPELSRLAARYPGLRHHVVPYLIGEDRTGHMASVVFRPGALRRLLPRPPQVVHIIGEAGYLSTRQVLNLRRRWPSVPVTLYAAQNLVMRFPPPFPWLERRAFRAVDHVLPITPAALRVIRAKGYRGPATIVPLGVDTDLFRPAVRPPARRRFTAGFVGRFEANKGLPTLLAAAERIDCDVLLVGDGSLREQIAAAAARRPGRITVHGWAGHAELPSLLHRMDALVLPSVELMQRNVLPWIGIRWQEQFGRVLVEAMACGVPVVGSDQGEIPHVVGDAGHIFPAGDAAALARRLAALRDDPAAAARMAGRGVHRAATEFSWRHIAEGMSEVWHGLIAQPVPAEREVML